MPLYVGDYLADTGHLTTVEHGAYLLLIMHYWRVGSLPVDDAKLARIARMTATEWRKVRKTIAAFFDDDWKHARIEFEMTESERISRAGRCGGKASGISRKNKNQAKSMANSNDRSTTVQRSANDLRTKREALQSQSQIEEEKKDAADAADDPSALEREFFSRGKQVLGPTAGGLLKKLLIAKGGNVAIARSLVELASTKQDPREFVGAACRGPPPVRAVTVKDQQRVKWDAALDRLREVANEPENGGSLGGPALSIVSQHGRG